MEGLLEDTEVPSCGYVILKWKEFFSACLL